MLKLNITAIIMAFSIPLFICFSTSAFAAEVIEAATTTVNLGEMLEIIVGLVFAAASGALAWIVGKAFALFEQKTGVQIEDSTRAYLETAIENGLLWSRSKILEASSGKTSVEIESEVVAKTVQYLLDMVPDAIEYFGLTEDKLKQLVETRFAAASSK